MPPATRRRHQPQPQPQPQSEHPLDPPSDLDDVSHDDPQSGYMESVMAGIYPEAEDDDEEAPPGWSNLSAVVSCATFDENDFSFFPRDSSPLSSLSSSIPYFPHSAHLLFATAVRIRHRLYIPPPISTTRLRKSGLDEAGTPAPTSQPQTMASRMSRFFIETAVLGRGLH